ncbi:MAG: FAD-dependent oxidoreductase [Sulfolobaceae archaeon]
MSYDADVIIVGGGLGGLSAAISAAKKGLSAIVLERGEYSGAKNVSGGRMYVHALLKLIPDALERAPLERPITRETFEVYCEKGRKVIFSYENKNKKESYSVLRAKFDQWLAKEAENLGALISYSTQVVYVKREDNFFLISTNRGDLKSPLIIDAGGVTAPVSRSLGLRNLSPENFMIGVKEVINIKPEIPEDEGEAKAILGLLDGLKGGVFYYTNKDTISIGYTAKVESLQKSEKPAYEIIEDVREKLGLNGEILEYSAHLIPYYGYEKAPRLWDKGLMIVGDAAGLLINDGFTIRGMDLAITSGMVAGEVAAELKNINDYTKTYIYEERLKETPAYQDFINAKNAFKVLNSERLFIKYPKILCDSLEELFSVSGIAPRRRPIKVLIEKMKENQVNSSELIIDAWRFVT